MSFNDRDYTKDSLVKQLSLVELHSKDGSAVEAGCACIETKHLYAIEGLAEEGKGFSLTDQEKQFYGNLADLSRNLRKNIESEDWKIPKSSNSKCEAKIERCVKAVKKKHGCTSQADCPVNPYAVCRSSVRCG